MHKHRLLTTNTTPLGGFFADRSNWPYILKCKDIHFKETRFIERYTLTHSIWTAFLPTHVTHPRLFRAMFKMFNDRLIRKYGLKAIGCLERHNKPSDRFETGELHGHLLIATPLDLRAYRASINREWGRIWRRIHLRCTGIELHHGMPFLKPHDGSGARFARYLGKVLNRDTGDAKWGLDPQQSYLLKGGIDTSELWHRDELPSRKSPQREVEAYARQLAEWSDVESRNPLASNDLRNDGGANESLDAA